MLEVDGVITETSDVADFFGTVSEGMVGRVREELDRARSDDQVKALVLRINSPGGTVTGSDLLYDEIRRFKQERKVPVVAQLMGTAASGGYYVALAADEIHAERTTVTGSIGVIFSGFNLAGLMEKLGIENQTITSGGFKDAGIDAAAHAPRGARAAPIGDRRPLCAIRRGGEGGPHQAHGRADPRARRWADLQRNPGHASGSRGRDRLAGCVAAQGARARGALVRAHRHLSQAARVHEQLLHAEPRTAAMRCSTCGPTASPCRGRRSCICGRPVSGLAAAGRPPYICV